MSKSDTEAESAEMAVMDLLRRKDTTGAIGVLQQARSAARSRRDTALAGHFASLLGSLYLGEGRVDDALCEYETAEVDEPENMYHKLTTVRQLIDTGRAHEAVLKLDLISGALPPNASAVHDYHGLRGEAQLLLGMTNEALREFRLMADPDLVRGLKPASISLRLGALLVGNDDAREDILTYLGSVRAKGVSRGDTDLLDRVSSVERLIPGSL